MSYSYECPDCGANLDPGEACDCTKEKSILVREEHPSGISNVNDCVSHDGEILNGNELDKNKMIIIEQLPIIKEQLAMIKTDVTNKVSAALAMPCTEENYKEIKKLRTLLTKELTYWEEKRKFVKKAIFAPYEAFDKEYKVNVSDIFDGGIGELKKKIDTVEDGLKEEKKQNVKAYFDEYLAFKGGFDFIDFDRAGLVINLSTSEKKLKEQAKEFIDRICSDLALIETQKYKDEILYEYKTSLQVGEAVCIVAERYRAIEEAEAKKAEAMEQAEQKAETVQKVDKVLEQDAFIAPMVTTPQSPTETAPLTSGANTEGAKLYMVTFKVTDVLDKIKALKEFLEKEGINYEQL